MVVHFSITYVHVRDAILLPIQTKSSLQLGMQNIFGTHTCTHVIPPYIFTLQCTPLASPS